MKNKVLVIINPAAGRKAAQKALFPLVQSLCDHENLVTVYSTSGRDDAREFMLTYGKDFDRVICCGGDGTFNEVLSGILEGKSDIPVGYVPTGSTNDLARSIDLPTEINEAIELAIEGQAEGHDIGLFNGNRYFDYVASFGAFVKASYETPQTMKNALGHFAYILYGIPQAFDIKPYKMKVIADDQIIEGSFIFGSVSNAKQIAGIIKIPGEKVDLNDGLFEVILIKEIKPQNLVRGNNKAGELIDGEKNHYYFLKANKVIFYFEDEVDWTVDGEYAGQFNTVEIQNIHDAIRIIKGKKDEQ